MLLTSFLLLLWRMQMKQTTIELPAFSRGFHLISHEIEKALKENFSIQTGMMNLFIQHTSASLSINENADPSVLEDMESFYTDLADDKAYYIHTYEGADDMPAHIKSTLLGSSVNVPISQGRMNLGMWQGIYLGEHRDRAGGRNLILSVWGE
jgi:secondary thiamine-phosphate synthase enzyme